MGRSSNAALPDVERRPVLEALRERVRTELHHNLLAYRKWPRKTPISEDAEDAESNV
jgi:hypothetical protein